MTNTTQNSSPSQVPKDKPNKQASGQRDTHAADLASSIDIRDPDQFQETVLGFWHFIERHAAAFGAAILVGLLVLCGFVLKNWWHGREERKAQEAYYAVESKFTKLKEGFDRSKMRALMPNIPKDDKNPAAAPATGDIEKDYGQVIHDLEKIAQNHPGTAAGAQAAILATETYLSYGKPDQAVAIAEMAAKNLPAGSSPNPLLGSLVNVQYGSALAAKGNCDQAVKVWDQVLAAKSAKFLYADVSLREGLCYEQLNNPTKALEMYQKTLAEAGQESPLATTAKGLSRALEVKTKTAAAAK